MSAFEFIFGLFSLILGLGLAETLGGLARALRARAVIRIGWSTALLAVLVSCDILTFWMWGWTLRAAFVADWPVLFGVFLVTAAYYIAAALVFPSEADDWADMDGYFARQHRLVLGAILLCNIALAAVTLSLVPVAALLTLHGLVIFWSLFPVLLLAMFARDRRIVIAAMLWLIALYPLSAIWRV